MRLTYQMVCDLLDLKIDGVDFVAPTSLQLQVFDFDYQSPGKQTLWVPGANDAIRDLAVVIDNGFNDATATLTIGSDADPELLVSASDAILSAFGEYRVERTVIFDAQTPISLFIHPGTSDRGHGRVYYCKDKHP